MKKLLYITLTMLSAVSCSKQDSAHDREVRISSTIATRTEGDQWVSGDAIGLYMGSDSAYIGENAKYVTTGSGDFTSDLPLYFPATDTVDFLAYYPYVEGVNLEAYAVDVTDQSSQGALDLMMATKANVTYSPQPMNMTFEHQFSRVEFQFEAGDGMDADDFAGAEVILSGAIATGAYNLTNGAVTLGDGATDIKMSTTASGSIAEAIILPQSLTAAELSVKLNGDRCFVATLAEQTFEGGNEYKYTATISSNLQVSSTTIKAWGAGNDTVEDLNALLNNIMEVNGVYQIYSAKGLAQFVAKVNDNGYSLNAKLMTNINLAGVDGSGNGIAEKAFTPINSYSGIFDGNGFEISGLYLAETQSSANGFICTIGSDGVVKNLGISGLIQEGKDYSGSFAGTNYGRIFNCYSTATVVGVPAGGLVGDNRNAIENCYFAGNCANGEAITGDMDFQTINNCYYAKGSAESDLNGGEEKEVAYMQSLDFTEELNNNVSKLNRDALIACGWKWNKDAYPTLISGDYPTPNL